MGKREQETNEFTTWDGTRLFYRTWPPVSPTDRALILIHRGHEHSGRLQELVDDLDLPSFWAFSWDNRGHGKSPGQRGDAPSYSALVRDLDAFARHLQETHGLKMENIAVVANSVGAVTAAAWVHDYAPPIRSMVLAAPAFRIKLYVPFAIPALRLWRWWRQAAVINSYVKSRMLTHDPEQSRAYDEDKLITRNISVKILLGLHDTATRLLRDAGAIRTPTLVLSAGSDWVVKNSAQRRFFRGLSSAVKRMEHYAGFFHAILYEKGREKPINETRRFLLESFEHPVELPSLLEADRGGYSRTEHDLLRQPTVWPRQMLFTLQKKSIETVGRLSKGIRVGLRTGFDSGQSLDYVYENRARGLTPVGKWIDHAYLNTVGWRGIRIRRKHLQELLQKAIEDQLQKHDKIEIVDVATGCGRYVLEVLEKLPQEKIHARLRDWTPANLEQGRALAAEKGLENVEFELGDAFDRDGLLAISPQPHIIIVSGLYELFPENDRVAISLAGIAEVLVDRGYLLYTCQPWHPQLELIARTLVNREGEPWVMRRRTQAEMDELVAAAGLQKQDMRIDEYGIFTVSAARRV
ncbi:Alpha/beta hydrolase fold protein [Nitrosococcus oceani ATCC 19707]|uniref:Alpha/beta hydrolase fold protein n=2 Tax=Nitrosococcus oceani TaxID=1229 RepID=Q3JAE6_NITOC|nr:bifunctional alpha/beta hydrolase/class I SAM-dependent methyltransferase [Nitrosococcus oceani]ABA58200.1 Alpha/beta hydrolase fold protein [Nitrosococcus oceani ATCC 19707]EDZ68309.1 hydrolase, alpha/beta fold family protein [Nitrosococcus oceani AFC27]KFI19313.1 hypothetical protein IB75_09185 [Nitrosococcus oceani C-27]GEM20420.1 hypothetical protein NONS58_18360 [Nitrosococcus oceani]